MDYREIARKLRVLVRFHVGAVLTRLLQPHVRGNVAIYFLALTSTSSVLTLISIAMRAFQAFLQLPISLLVTSFALEATTAPIEGELKYLTPDNFKSTIAKGVW